MKPPGENVLQKWPLSKRVNSSRTPDDDPTLIERLEEVLRRAQKSKPEATDRIIQPSMKLGSAKCKGAVHCSRAVAAG
jgi:hypothetical protein